MQARIAANEMPLNCTEIEAFCIMMYTLVGPVKPTGFHGNGAPSGMETVLVSRLFPFFRGESRSTDCRDEPIIAKQRFIRVLDKCGRMTVSLSLLYLCLSCCLLSLVFLSPCVRAYAERACCYTCTAGRTD